MVEKKGMIGTRKRVKRKGCESVGGTKRGVGIENRREGNGHRNRGTNGDAQTGARSGTVDRKWGDKLDISTSTRRKALSQSKSPSPEVTTLFHWITIHLNNDAFSSCKTILP